MGSDTVSRQARKRHTRETIIQAALELCETHGFAGLSLREVARAARLAPAALYRHFDGREALGLALVEESFGTLRLMMREARAERFSPEDALRGSVEILVRHVHRHRLHFRFIARERSGGVAALRRAIRWEIRLFTSELTADLARMPYLSVWELDELQMLASLVVSTMVATAEEILDVPPDQPEVEVEVIRTAEQKLRLIFLGVPHWRSDRRLPALTAAPPQAEAG